MALDKRRRKSARKPFFTRHFNTLSELSRVNPTTATDRESRRSRRDVVKDSRATAAAGLPGSGGVQKDVQRKTNDFDSPSMVNGPCEICSGLKRGNKFKVCSECHTSKVHIACLDRIESSTSTASKWICSTCHVRLSGRSYSRTRALRSRTIDLEQQASATKTDHSSPTLERSNILDDIGSELSDPPDIVDELDSFGIIDGTHDMDASDANDFGQQTAVHQESARNRVEEISPIADKEAIEVTRAGSLEVRTTPDTDGAVTAEEAIDHEDDAIEGELDDGEDDLYEGEYPEDVEQDDDFVDAQDIVIDPALLNQPESSITTERVLRTRNSASHLPDANRDILQTQSLPSRELRSTTDTSVTSHPSPAVTGLAPRRRGRPRIHPIVESRSRQTDRRRFPDVYSGYTTNAGTDSDADRTVSRTHTAPAVESRQLALKLLRNHRKFDREAPAATAQENKLIVFDRSRASFIAKFNLVQLASHIDIHKNNLAISGYLTYDHTDKNVYTYPKVRSGSVNNDIEKEKPYGGILSASQASTARTAPGSFDRMIFGKTLLLTQQHETQTEHRKRKRAANMRKQKLRNRRRPRETSSEDEYSDNAMVIGRPRRRRGNLVLSPSSLSNFSADAESSDVSSASTDDELEETANLELVAGASKIRAIRFGKYEIETWYTAPYPEEYNRRSFLYICEFCLKYMPTEYVNWRHEIKCPMRHPPGDEIYRAGKVSIFEVDGRKNPMYCQNLCLLAKLFLGSKTLYYDVEPFLFYILTETDERGCHFVGYFSKEKQNSSSYNVSCILTLPIHQRKGYGNFLISFSYLLTRTEGKTGTPEKPLSDLGLLSYRNYWKYTLCYVLRDLFFQSGRSEEAIKKVSIMELSARTGMTADDVVCGLEALNALVRDPETGAYAVRVDHTLIKSQIAQWEAKGYINLEPDKLIWTSMVVGKSGGVNSLFFAVAGVQPAVSSAAAAEQAQRVEAVSAEQLIHRTSFAQQAATPSKLQSRARDAAEADSVAGNHNDQVPTETPEIPIDRYEIVMPQSLAGVPRWRLWSLEHRLERERQSRLDQGSHEIDNASAPVEEDGERETSILSTNGGPNSLFVHSPRRRGRPLLTSVTLAGPTRSTRHSGHQIFAGELPKRQYRRHGSSIVMQEEFAQDESPDQSERVTPPAVLRSSRKRREVVSLPDSRLVGRRSLRERR
ncbi:hypothetical protein V1509DRAFT_620801 [Lipomyces kononenkoae]